MQSKSGGGKQHLEVALKLAKEADQMLSQAIVEDIVPVMSEGETLTLQSIEEVLAPKVALAHILVAQAEALLCSSTLPTATDLESGREIKSLLEEDKLMSTVSAILNSSLEALACPELVYFPVTLNYDPDLYVKRLGMPSPPGTPLKLSLPPTNALSPPTSKSDKRTNSRKMSVSSRVSTTPDAKNKARPGSKARSASNSRPGTSAGDGGAQGGTSASKVDMVLATNINDRYQHLVQMVHTQGNRESVKAAEVNNLKSRHGASFAKGAINRASSKTGANDFGIESVRSELFLNTHTDSDEVHSWIQWAIAASDGLGLGFMGLQGAVDEVETPARSAEFFRDVKSRLHDAEKMISPDDFTSQMLISCVIMKVCAQLNLRKEAGSYAEQYEQHADRLQDIYHQALARKYRYDFEEWNTYIKEGGITAKLRRFMLLLGFAKSYYRAAEKTADLQLQRDAIKRVLNVFIEVAQVSTQSGNPVEANLQDELDMLSPEEVDEKETTDIHFLKKYSRTRATEFLERLKEKRVQGSGEDKKGYGFDDGLSVPSDDMSIE